LRLGRAVGWRTRGNRTKGSPEAEHKMSILERLRALGAITIPSKTDSEVLFEGYLKRSGYDFEFEKSLPETSKKPDYAVTFEDQLILFELKEFQPMEDDFKPGGGAFDPYRPIREKINAAREKFRKLQDYTCALVLFN